MVVTSSEVTLSCKVETAPAITVEYEWFTCQQDGTGKQPVDCFRNEMTLPAIIRSQGYYVCDVTSKSSDMVISRITSDVAHVEVVNSTEITVKPDDEPPKERYVEFKDKLVLEFKASCKHYPVKYQWYYNGKELPNATTSTLIVPSVAEHNVGSYYCEASSDYSAQPVMSGICRVQWS